MKRKRALVYCRTAQPDAHTLEMQKAHLLNYALEQELDVAGVVVECGSGLDYPRDGLTEVLVSVEDGDADVLLVSSLCRLGRDIRKTYALLHWLNAHNVKIVCADGTQPQTFVEIFDSLCQRCSLPGMMADSLGS